METKHKCTKCNRLLDVTEFYPIRVKHNRFICKDCEQAYQRAYRERTQYYKRPDVIKYNAEHQKLNNQTEKRKQYMRDYMKKRYWKEKADGNKV